MHRPHPRTRPVVAACAVLAAALLALSGCASDGGAGHDPARAGGSGSPPATPGADLTGRTAHRKSPAASHRPALPDSRLTPATGSFTKREKKYLSGRVPDGTDPAAVLQLGQEACQRVRRTAAHDRDAAVGALIAGDVPGAEDAVTQLCPDQLPVLKAARAGFPDGTRKRPAAGTYRALTPSASCVWRAVGASGRTLASGGATGEAAGHGGSDGPGGGPGAKVTAKVPDGTRTFVSSGCYAWVRA